MKIPSIVAAAAALALAASASQATVIHSAYSPLGGHSWLASFTVTNDGTPTAFAGFTIDFVGATNLALVASPGAWDSAVFQPDANLPDNGFLDSFVLNAANALGVGQSVGGFQVSFTAAAGATPGALPFMVYSETFAPLFAGSTTVSAVPEPATALLAALGFAVVGHRARRGARIDRRIGQEVTA